MVYIRPICAILILTLLSSANAYFTPLGDWILVKDTSFSISDFPNQFNGGSPVITSSDGTSISDDVSCNSISMNQKSYSLAIDLSTTLANINTFTIGFWAYFESTISSQVFQFGANTGVHYIVSSTANGVLKVSYYEDASTTDSNSDFTINVPLSNAYIDKWFFIAFGFLRQTNTLEISISGAAKISKTAASGSTVPFEIPDKHFYFGQGVKGKFHEVWLAMGASVSADLKTISLTDGGGNSLSIATSCAAGSCDDASCLVDGACLSLKHLCTDCSGSTCNACNPDFARTEASYCQSCESTATLTNGYCCDTLHKCGGCSTKSTVCDFCAADHFLYDDGSTSTTCLACDNSCTVCEDGVTCFQCAETIAHDSTKCRVDSLGYQLSFASPNIVVDFAHTLQTGLATSWIRATSNAGAALSTGSWGLTGCTAGLKQCNIAASNLQESQLPIEIDFEFTQI